MGHNSSGSRELAILTAAERKLATCTEFDEVLDIRDEAETVRLFAQKQRLGLQLQNQAAKIKIQAERRLGEALRQIEASRGRPKIKVASCYFDFAPQGSGDQPEPVSTVAAGSLSAQW